MISEKNQKFVDLARFPLPYLLRSIYDITFSDLATQDNWCEIEAFDSCLDRAIQSTLSKCYSSFGAVLGPLRCRFVFDQIQSQVFRSIFEVLVPIRGKESPTEMVFVRGCLETANQLLAEVDQDNVAFPAFEIFVGFLLFGSLSFVKLYKKVANNVKLQRIGQFYHTFYSKYKNYLLIDIAKKPEIALENFIFQSTKKLLDFYELVMTYKVELIVPFLASKPKYLTYGFPNVDRKTVFHLAAAHGEISLFKSLYEIFSQCLDLTDAGGLTPLYDAVVNDRLEMVRFLIDLGANVNKIDKKNSIPLYSSIMFSSPEMTKLLIEKGSNPNLQNYVGRTPLMKAIYTCQEEKTKHLLESKEIALDLVDNNQRGAIHMACWGEEGGREGKLLDSGRIGAFAEGLRMLLDRKADISLRDREGFTALHVSCSTKAMNCLEIWKDVPDLDWNEPNGYFENTLMISIRYNNLEVLQWLISNGKVTAPLLERREKRGFNALDYGISYDRPEMFEILLDLYRDRPQDIEEALKKFSKIEFEKSIVKFVCKDRKLCEFWNQAPIDEVLQDKFVKSLTDQDLIDEVRRDDSLFRHSDGVSIICSIFKNLRTEVVESLRTEDKRLDEAIMFKGTEILSNLSKGIESDHKLGSLVCEILPIDFLVKFKDDQSRTMLTKMVACGQIDNFQSLFQRIKADPNKNFYFDSLLAQEDNHHYKLIDYLLKTKHGFLASQLSSVTIEHTYSHVKLVRTRPVSEETLNEIKKIRGSKIPKDFINKVVNDPEIKRLRESLISCDRMNIPLYDQGIEAEFVDTEEGLKKLLPELQESQLIAFDFEYGIPTNSSIRIFDLIQIATPKHFVIIDPHPVFEFLKTWLDVLLNSTSSVKLLFSCFSDASILFYFLSMRMTNFVDLSVMNKMYRNETEQVGLRALTKDLLDIDLDKSAQCSHWNVRPLPKSMKDYAMKDVLILLVLFRDFLMQNSSDENLVEAMQKTDEMYKKLKTKEQVDSIQKI